MKKLLIVEEVFAGGGRGVTLLPRITVAEAPPSAFPVRLRFPDGREREVTASMQVAHIRGPHGAYAMVKLNDVDAADLPPGTEVWMVD